MTKKYTGVKVKRTPSAKHVGNKNVKVTKRGFSERIKDAFAHIKPNGRS